MIFHQAAFLFIVRKILKRSSLPLLVIFWAYTWHAYAIGAVGQKDPFPEPQKSGFQQHSSQGKLLSTIHNKVQFKRRPFITKGDVVLADPFLLDEPLSVIEYSIRLKVFAFQCPSEINYFLRAPPSLI